MKTFVQKIRQWIQLKRRNEFFYREEELKYQQQLEKGIVKARLERNKAS